MSNPTESAKFEVARADAVRALWTEKVRYMSREVLYAIVSRYSGGITGEEFEAIMTWLKDRGYVKFKIERLGGHEFYSFRLTASGQELALGNLADPGVATI